MSLSVFVNPKLPTVCIVRWFRDPKVTLDYASSPIVQMSQEEFRSTGWNWILRHFEEYAKSSINPKDPKDWPRILKPGEGEGNLEGRVAVWLKIDQPGKLDIVPKILLENSIVGTKNLPRADWQTIPLNCSPEVYWTAFDKAVTAALTAAAGSS